MNLAPATLASFLHISNSMHTISETGTTNNLLPSTFLWIVSSHPILYTPCIKRQPYTHITHPLPAIYRLCTDKHDSINSLVRCILVFLRTIIPLQAIYLNPLPTSPFFHIYTHKKYFITWTSFWNRFPEHAEMGWRRLNDPA